MATEALSSFLRRDFSNVTRTLNALSSSSSSSTDDPRIKHNALISRFYAHPSHAVILDIVSHCASLLPSNIQISTQRHPNQSLFDIIVAHPSIAKTLYNSAGHVPLYNLTVIAYHYALLDAALILANILFDHIEALDDSLALASCFLIIDIQLRLCNIPTAQAALSQAEKLIPLFVSNSSSNSNNNNNNSTGNSMSSLASTPNASTTSSTNPATSTTPSSSSRRNQTSSNANNTASSNNSNVDLPVLSPPWRGRDTALLTMPSTTEGAKFLIHLYHARIAHALDSSSSSSSSSSSPSSSSPSYNSNSKSIQRPKDAYLLAAADAHDRPAASAAALLVKAHIEQKHVAKSVQILTSIAAQCTDDLSLRKVRPLALNSLGVLHHRLGRHALATCYLEQSRRAFGHMMNAARLHPGSDAEGDGNGGGALQKTGPHDQSLLGNGEKGGVESAIEHEEEEVDRRQVGDGNDVEGKAKLHKRNLESSSSSSTAQRHENDENQRINNNNSISIVDNNSDNIKQSSSSSSSSSSIPRPTHTSFFPTSSTTSSSSSSSSSSKFSLSILNVIKDSHVAYNLALQYMQTGEYERALNLFSSCARTDKTLSMCSALLWIRMAECCVGMECTGASLSFEGRGRSRRMILRSAHAPDIGITQYATVCARAALDIIDKQTRSTNPIVSDGSIPSSSSSLRNEQNVQQKLNQQQKQQQIQDGLPHVSSNHDDVNHSSSSSRKANASSSSLSTSGAYYHAENSSISSGVGLSSSHHHLSNGRNGTKGVNDDVDDVQSYHGINHNGQFKDNISQMNNHTSSNSHHPHSLPHPPLNQQQEQTTYHQHTASSFPLEQDASELRGTALTLLAYASLSFDPVGVIQACDQLGRLYARTPGHERWTLAQLYAAEALCMLRRPKDAAKRLAPLLAASFPLESDVREAAYVNMALTHACADDTVTACRAARLALKMYASGSQRHRDIRRQAVFAACYIYLRNGDTEAAREALRLAHIYSAE